MYLVSFFKPKISRGPLTMVPLSKQRAECDPKSRGALLLPFPLASVLNKQEWMSSCKAQTELGRGASKGLWFQ